uniref:Putative secreted protein n=1 Tax=Anopheles triannulatus TaxID=58253 RepID=A0A2M4B767_9DIPT
MITLQLFAYIHCLWAKVVGQQLLVQIYRVVLFHVKVRSSGTVHTGRYALAVAACRGSRSRGSRRSGR